MSRPLLAGAGAALALAASLTGVTAIPAHADPPRPPTTYCNPAVDGQWIGVISATVQPVVTQFLSLNVTPGTTGTRTHTLTRVASVTTTVNQSTEITVEAKALFLRVAATVGFSVQSVTSTTDTESTSMTWNFVSPGHYGMYKGTRRVNGEWAKWLCARTGPDRGVWLNALPGGKGSYITYEHLEEGTVSCATAEPPGTLRHAASAKLSCTRAGRPA